MNFSNDTRQFITQIIQTYPADMSTIEKNQEAKKDFIPDQEYLNTRKLYPDGTLTNYTEFDLSMFSLEKAEDSIVKAEDSIVKSQELELINCIKAQIPTLEKWQKRKLISTFFEALLNPFTTLFDLELYKKSESTALSQIKAILSSNPGKKPSVLLLSTAGIEGEMTLPPAQHGVSVMFYKKLTKFMNYFVSQEEGVTPYTYVSHYDELENTKRQIASLLFEGKKQEALEQCAAIPRSNIQKKFEAIINNGTY